MGSGMKKNPGTGSEILKAAGRRASRDIAGVNTVGQVNRSNAAARPKFLRSGKIYSIWNVTRTVS